MMNSQERVRAAIQHQAPDRTPVDLVATSEVWDILVDYFQPDIGGLADMAWLQPEREAILRLLGVDLRLFSYDMFCAPPDSIIKPGAEINWWDTLMRSTPNRMWRQVMPDGAIYDIWVVHFKLEQHMFGQYEGHASWPLGDADTVGQLKQHAWPHPDWWDFPTRHNLRPTPPLSPIGHRGCLLQVMIHRDTRRALTRNVRSPSPGI